MKVSKSKIFGRGRGSFRHGDGQKSETPEKKIKNSFRMAPQNINFDPKEFIVAQCSQRDVEIFKQVFDFLDDDHDGMLTPLDLRKAIRQYGQYKPGRAFVYVAMSVFDNDDGGQISFKQFVKLMTQKPCENDTNEDIMRIFDYIDEDHKGFISIEDLETAAEELKEDITKKQIKEMIKSCDPNGNGVISPQAFLAYNKRKTFD